MVTKPEWDQWEDEWAAEVGGEKQPASGSTFHSKLDVRGHGVLWSVKYTKFKSYSITQDDLREIEMALTGTGGVGSEIIGAMAIRIGDPKYDIVVLRKDDFLRIVKERLTFVKESRVEEKRARARMPILFREDDRNRKRGL